jgi:CheY-like chemotaxis protein
LKELLSRTLRLATVSEHVNWELSVPDDLLPAEVDPEQIDRVIFNLVRNACDAMNNHGHLSVRAQNVNLGKENPLQMEPGNYVSITVRDYGPGIPAENMKHLFHSRFTTKPNGNGCGLPICHHVIKDHGGEIFVSSKESVGTAFAIFLPACDLVSLPKNLTPQPTAADLTAPSANASDPTPVASAPAAAATKEAPVIFTGPPTILIVDDDDVIRMVTSEIARQLGYEVESAAEGEEALNILRSRQKEHRRMDGILMDINLRGKRNGVDTLHEIHRMEITIPVIATSGEHRDQTYYQALGFQRFLAKPYKVEELDKILRETLAS